MSHVSLCETQVNLTEMLIDAGNKEYPSTPVNPYRKLLGIVTSCFFFMILDTINSLVLEGWNCLLCTKMLLTKLFHISVCDVLPHLLASNNLKVDVTKQNGKDRDSQDDEVCIVYFQHCVGFFKSYSIKTLVHC